jgi:glycosyltransferase involved in cell wall biosynthesis
MGAPEPPLARSAPDSSLVLWYGGLWPWFDGATALAAFAIAAREDPSARLRIIGGRHPSGGAPDTLDAVLADAAAAGLSDRVESVPWVAHDTLPTLLGEAACALCLAHEGIEHRLAQRTRLLDLLSAGIPFIVTEGDSLGGRAVAAGAATGVPPGDASAAGTALRELLADAALRAARGEAGQRLARELAPEKTLAEAVRWLSSPRTGARTPPSWRRRR